MISSSIRLEFSLPVTVRTPSDPPHKMNEYVCTGSSLGRWCRMSEIHIIHKIQTGRKPLCTETQQRSDKATEGAWVSSCLISFNRYL